MFIYDFIRLILSITISFFTVEKYINYLPVDAQLSDWIMRFIANKNPILISNLLLLLIFFLMYGPIKQIAINFIFKNKINCNYTLSENLLLSLLVFVTILFLYHYFKFFLILPGLSFIFIKLIIILFNKK